MSTELTVPLPKVTEAIAEYQNQFEMLRQQLEQLERNFNEQKANGINTLNMLTGAIKALEQLQNVAVPVVPPAPPQELADVFNSELCRECEERREDSQEVS